MLTYHFEVFQKSVGQCPTNSALTSGYYRFKKSFTKLNEQ